MAQIGNVRWRSIASGYTAAGIIPTYVAVGGDPGDGHVSITHSYLGEEWQDIMTFRGVDYLTCVTYGNGKWVALGPTGSRGNKCCYTTSETAYSWPPPVSIISGRNNGAPRDIIFADNKFIAVLDNEVLTSTDGVNWTLTGTFSGDVYSIVAANNVYVMGGSHWIFFSTDTVTWEKITPPGSGVLTSNHMNGAAYGNNMFMLLASNGEVYTSPDGQTWEEQQKLNDNYRYARLRFINGLFVVAGGKYGSTGICAYSKDGTSWEYTEIGNEFLYDVCLVTNPNL